MLITFPVLTTSPQSPLHMAARGEYSTIVKLLREQGANPNLWERLEGSTPLHIIARNGSYRCYEAIHVAPLDPQLIPETHVQVNTKNKEGQTALHLCSMDQGAFRKSSAEMVSSMIAQGADLNALDGAGATPLHYASRYGAWEICNLLVSHGAKKLVKNQEGQYPLDVVLQDLSSLLNIDEVEQRLLRQKMISLLSATPPRTPFL